MSKTRKPTDIETSKILTRFLPSSTAPSNIDVAARTVRFAFSSARPVTRYIWHDDLPEGGSSEFNEVLPTRSECWNMERVVQRVCPFLRNHSRDKKLGAVTAVEFGDEFVYATVKLRSTIDSDEFLADCADPDLAGGISFGYSVSKYKVLTPAIYEGEGWDRKLITPATLEAAIVNLYEVSSEAVPADPTVGFNRASIDLRTIQIEGDPHWERATPDELKIGDWVGFHTSNGTGKGQIKTIATSGSALPTQGTALEGTLDNPAYLITLWEDGEAGWAATDTSIAKRAAALTEIASLKQAAAGAQKQQRKSQETVMGKRKQTNPNIQARLLTLEDYLSAPNPTLSDVSTALEATFAAIDDAATTDTTLDTTTLYQAAIDDMADQLYSIYGVPDPDAAEDAAEPEPTTTITGAKTMDQEKEKPQETERDREYKTLQAKVQLMERRESVTRKFTTLRQRAEVLKASGKLTPAEFKDKFGDIDAAIALYTEADDSRISGLEERLNDIEKYTPAVEFGSRLKSEPLEVPETKSVHDAELEAYQKSKGKK
jgi:hypothetical protein